MISLQKIPLELHGPTGFTNIYREWDTVASSSPPPIRRQGKIPILNMCPTLLLSGVGRGSAGSWNAPSENSCRQAQSDCSGAFSRAELLARCSDPIQTARLRSFPPFHRLEHIWQHSSSPGRPNRNGSRISETLYTTIQL